MNLSQSEIELFFKLWYGLVWGINEKHKIISRFKKPVYGTRVSVSIEEFKEIRDAMWDNPEWISEFLVGRGLREFSEQEREIITSWRKCFLKGRFLVTKHLTKYSVLMTFENNPLLLYGVHGISDSLQDTLPRPLPYAIELVLLPFNGKIIYDSLLVPLSLSFGPGIRGAMKEWYNESKERYGIIEVLSGEAPVPRLPDKKPEKKAPKAKAAPPETPVHLPKGVNVPKAMSARYVEVADIIRNFCEENLNDEYKDICLRALQKLCRKRLSPLASGKARTWACGIVYAVGSHNFLFDKSQPLHMTAEEIAQWFGLAKGTASVKASEINKLLDLSYYNTEFMLQDNINDNPAIWYLNVNGFTVDVRNMPLEVQEEAFRRGLIPYIPGDRKER